MQAKHCELLNGTKEISPIELPGPMEQLLLRLYSDVTHHEGVALVGGCLRDLMHGAEPKDVDVALYGMSQRRAEQLVAGMLGFLDPLVFRAGGWSSQYADCGDSGIFVGVLQLVGCRGLNGYDVDFNYYNAGSLGRVLESFDFTINQVATAYHWPDPEGGPELGTYLHKDVIWGVNKEVGSGSRRPERREKMLAKAANYGWENAR
ncbi:hypothetical protein FBPa25_0021 [Pseudomonas phage vB_PaeP_FBPa25]|uniref:Poly A polymerase head domain-containing protein n=3 Tax=Viruses TaxID=10239 RepID=A0A9E7QMM2_9CAUD|nr:hypothetical protein [Pseudomonas phage HX1]UKH49137.1 putative nucleotidyl transferase [Pseudomonas phage vB_Pae_S1]UVN13050.1 hypothetical protein FBPa3_0020 [Pseudomonas phage vB_PaeM_FBPa3]UVN13555.1 hypothetical protein FBPa18_0026 [Pseudomonas phage vB_PaeP_FBPa18]UVN13718.1 hypothetical protein FBPa25_0021 [Pseudomonas phage vB_PaeP_FBPa25]